MRLRCTLLFKSIVLLSSKQSARISVFIFESVKLILKLKKWSHNPDRQDAPPQKKKQKQQEDALAFCKYLNEKVFFRQVYST